ncbi:chromate efflux transporter [Shewanella marina]|uniref:chromate efflux transporter n=1 Tax=Shewanella marina TaxID=487319 RepID=UPI0004713A6B|nr:chromate efflux transporter [Shewanella marina]
MWQIFSRFLALGLVSFGGPAAHIGYFRKTFVDELAWLPADKYASLVALSQFLPGPGSSQVGFAIGYHRGGLFGGMAAFLGFTLPSFVLLLLLALTSSQFMQYPITQGIIHGLKLMAVVIVADAVLTMFKQFCRCKVTQAFMAIMAAIALVLPNQWLQIGALLIFALLGSQLLVKADTGQSETREPLALGWGYLLLFSLLLLTSFIGLGGELGKMAADFYQVGCLVFGGGHVVLPLLQASVGQAVTPDEFLTGYALAQAVPGPMFTLATFLGAEMLPEQAFIGAVIATLAIFLPGFLLMLAALKSWHSISARPRIAAGLAGINAAVVGLLLAALYQPVFSSAVLTSLDMVWVILGFALLKIIKPNILLLVFGFAGLGAGLAFI